QVLADLGYDASVKSLMFALQFTYTQNTKNKVQISFGEWDADYPGSSDFLEVLFSCASFHPGSDESPNLTGICDPELDKLMARARVLAATDPDAAAQLWVEADKKVTDAAYIAALFTPPR